MIHKARHDNEKQVCPPRPLCLFSTVYAGRASEPRARRVKGRRGRGAYARPSSLASSSVTATSTPRSSRTAQSQRYRALSAAGWTPAPSSTPMAGAATTAWSISGMATSASIMVRTSLPREPSTSMASKASGGWPRSGWQSLKASPDTPSICTSKKPNGDTIIARLTSIRPCYSTCAKTLSARQDPSSFACSNVKALPTSATLFVFNGLRRPSL